MRYSVLIGLACLLAFPALRPSGPLTGTVLTCATGIRSRLAACRSAWSAATERLHALRVPPGRASAARGPAGARSARWLGEGAPAARREIPAP